MRDILFKTDEYVFSYRVAGVCVRDGLILLQKPTNDDGYAFPGGHASFGETNEQTLVREFREEIGAAVTVGALRWVGEVFFPWGERACHQICLYYDVTIDSPETPTEGVFPATEQLEGRSFKLEFHWVPLTDVGRIPLYPTDTAALLTDTSGGIRHFVYREGSADI